MTRKEELEDAIFSHFIDLADFVQGIRNELEKEGKHNPAYDEFLDKVRALHDEFNNIED